MADTVRLIKRYANRKLYDTGSGELTSLRRIEDLVRNGVDIRVLDHDTGEDMTSGVLVGILSNRVGAETIESDKSLLMSLIRAPGELRAAMAKHEQSTEELRTIGERVRLLSAAIDALLDQMDQPGGEDADSASAGKATKPKRPAPRKRAGSAQSRRS